MSESLVDVIEEQRRAEREAYLELRQRKLKTGYVTVHYGRLGFERQKEVETDSEEPRVSLIVKADVDGSIDAIVSCLDTYHEDEVKLDLVNFGVGQVTESDISMAESFGAIIYVFNTQTPSNILKQADSVNVPVRSFNVIYHLINDLKLEITSRMPQLEVEDVLGRANVLQEFQIKDKKELLSVAGCRIVSGKLSRSSSVKVMRGEECVYQGDLLSLKHLKDEVSEAVQNQECGIRVSDPGLRFEPGDVILAVETRLENDECRWDPGF